LLGRPRIVALNKIDVPDAKDLAEMVRADIAASCDYPVFEVSAATRAGLRELGFAMAEAVAASRAATVDVEPARIVLRPRAAREAGFTVEAIGEQEFVVSGDRPRRWVLQTDFTNDEAVGYLADRLARLGVEDQLAKLGAQQGAAVTIGEVTFDWEPTLRDGVGLPHGLRGTDERLEDHNRPRAEDRKAARKARRTAYDEEVERLAREAAAEAVDPADAVEKTGESDRVDE